MVESRNTNLTTMQGWVKVLEKKEKLQKSLFSKQQIIQQLC